jgi:hypothetical protein
MGPGAIAKQSFAGRPTDCTAATPFPLPLGEGTLAPSLAHVGYPGDVCLDRINDRCWHEF